MGNLITDYFVDIDNSDSFFGTSCLRIGSVIKPFNYLSHLLYNIDIKNKDYYIRIVFK